MYDDNFELEQIEEKRHAAELTYRELYEKLDNVWSVLFTTGYLT